MAISDLSGQSVAAAVFVNLVLDRGPAAEFSNKIHYASRTLDIAPAARFLNDAFFKKTTSLREQFSPAHHATMMHQLSGDKNCRLLSAAVLVMYTEKQPISPEIEAYAKENHSLFTKTQTIAGAKKANIKMLEVFDIGVIAPNLGLSEDPETDDATVVTTGSQALSDDEVDAY